MIETIDIRNVLSFGNIGVKANLHKINLLIGKNLTGKSNFMTAVKMSHTKNGKHYDINGREVYNSLAVVDDDFIRRYTNMLEIFNNSNIKDIFISEIQKFNSEFSDFNFTNAGGYINIIEKSRDIYLSELPRSYQHYLTIIAELLNPCSKVAFIEPENFIHTDNLFDILNLVNKVSEENNKQVFIKTYSRDVLDYYSDNPEYLIAFEKENGVTKTKQFIEGQLNEYLKKYSLGDIWSKGLIDGNVY